MIPVKRLIAEHLDDHEQIFVFPSEVAAEFWRRASLELTDGRAIWEDRFLSWDRFKEESFALTQRAAPINRRMRMLFAADLLRRNASSESIFSSLVSPAYAESSPAFLRTLTRILPELSRYRELARRSGGPTGSVDPATHADLEGLWGRYQRFLAENNLFEPSYDRIDVSRLPHRYHVFFPEVIEDWKEAFPHLATDRIRVVSAPQAPPTAIRRFENSVRELRALFHTVSTLLGDGVAPEEIALTVPRLDAWESLLRREAELRDIPLDIRQGHPLAEYPVIGLFERLAACVSGGYRLDALKALFSCRAYPWRHRTAGEQLVRWGIDHHCAGRYRAGGELHDPWREKLAAVSERGGSEGGRARSLGSFYASFARDAGALLAARSFRELHGSVQRFIAGWLDTGRWGAESLRIFQFALDALNNLVEAERLASGIDIADPYTLWLVELRERLYVPRSSAGGVPVYPYRVSAGISPAYHFVVGTTQQATQVEWTPLFFLREDERESLGIGTTSATEDFLNLYLQSGSRVELSYSAEDFVGVELPPAYFVLREAIERSDAGAGPAAIDPYRREVEVWGRGAANGAAGAARPLAGLEPLHAVQKSGAAFFRRVSRAEGRVDLTRSLLPDAALASRLRARVSDGEGRLKVSPTRLEQFRACPFAYLFTAALGVEERSYAIEWSDPRRIGALIHELLRGFFEEIGAAGEPFDPHRLPDYERLLASKVETLFRDWEEAGDAFVPPVWGALRPHLVRKSELFLAAEAKQFPHLAVAALERSYAEPREGVVLEGRIDRVSRSDEGAVLVDYKRNNHVRRADLGVGGEPDAESEEGPAMAASFQIPLYVMLLEGQGERVRAAAYYDFEKGRYQLVYDELGGRPWLDRDGLERLLAASETAVDEMAQRVASGNWRVPDLQSGCEDCRLRSVCRMKYVVR